jgi:hypothetical protein
MRRAPAADNASVRSAEDLRLSAVTAGRKWREAARLFLIAQRSAINATLFIFVQANHTSGHVYRTTARANASTYNDNRTSVVIV